jgi:hypothetical protein
MGYLQCDEILQERETKILDTKQTLTRDRKINQIALARIKASEDGCSANAIQKKQLLKDFLSDEIDKLRSDCDLRFEG